MEKKDDTAKKEELCESALSGKKVLGQRCGGDRTGVEFALEPLAEAPFVPTYLEQLQLGGERTLTWKRLRVSAPEGFVEIVEPCDVEQIYADGELVADNFYYGKTWRVPAKLLYGKECYLVMSEMRADFYREF